MSILTIRVGRELLEKIDEAALKRGLTYRGEPNRSELIRLAVERLLQEESPENVERLKFEEEKKIRKYFELRNRGLKPWEIAEEIPDPELIDKLLKREKGWKESEGLEKAITAKVQWENNRIQKENVNFLVWIWDRQNYIRSEYFCKYLNMTLKCIRKCEPVSRGLPYPTAPR